MNSPVYPQLVRFLLVNNHCISDPIAGVTQSLRTIVEWLADAGHACHVLTTARFESAVTFTIEEHLAHQGVPASAFAGPPRRRSTKAGRSANCPVVRYTVRDVPVTLLLTRHNNERRPDRAEAAQFLTLFAGLLNDHAPDVVIAANGHPMIFEAMRDARRKGVTTAFAVRGFGYYDRSYFENVDHVFTCSRFLTGVYEDKIGLVSTPLEPPLDWATVRAPVESRAFVTFVNPAPHKGLLLFARLADMLGSRRPDIPVLVVQSGQSGGSLNNIPGIDFSRYPQLMAAPPVQTPREYFALTRVLLVPSVWEEPFGRVAAEAMVNGIPPIVSNRGALPDVVEGDASTGGGGLVRAVPEWMTPDTTRVPGAEEIESWFSAVCALWDDSAQYESISARGREIADARYREDVSRAKHVQYFTSLAASASPFRTERTPP
jgi:glycosyltransferase involved in cell wall biosynthesis